MMQPDEREVLDAIALTEDLPLGSLWVEQGVVWHRDTAGSVRTVCQVGTPFWCEHEAAALAAQLIRRASGAAKQQPQTGSVLLTILTNTCTVQVFLALIRGVGVGAHSFPSCPN